jgi:hypothetical protein
MYEYYYEPFWMKKIRRSGKKTSTHHTSDVAVLMHEYFFSLLGRIGDDGALAIATKTVC